MSQLTDIALRGAAVQMVDIGSDKPIEVIQDETIELAASFVRGQEDASKQQSELSFQASAIGVAIKIMAVSYLAVNEHLKHLGRQRLSFDKERNAGIATFFIPTMIESRDKRKEQAALTEYMDLFSHDDDILRYMGIRFSVLKNDDPKKEGQFYSVMPFYQMSQFLTQPLSSQAPSDKARRAVDSFLNTQPPLFLGEIDEDFDDNWQITDAIDSWWEGANFLNEFRGPRLIIISLGNLLWNLQHPVDLDTRLPLGIDERIKLCERALLYINRLIDPKTPPNLCVFKGDVLNYARQVETFVTELHDAFIQEKLNSLRMHEVTARAHGTAKILDKNVFELIFYKGNHAQELAVWVHYLSRLLKKDPGLMAEFPTSKRHVGGLNSPPLTVIDSLIIFSHLDKNKRKRIIRRLKESGIASRDSYAAFLSSIDDKFITPLYEFCKKAIKDGRLHAEKKEAQVLSAERLLPLIGLAIRDHRLEVDTEHTIQQAHNNRAKGISTLTAKEQLEFITREAYENSSNTTGKYTWDLSSYLDVGDRLINHLNQLPRRQYKIGQLTALLDLLQNFIDKYKSFLLYPRFKKFLIRCLESIGEEFKELKALLSAIDRIINSDKSERRRLMDTIRTMDKDLLDEISKFTSVISSLEGTLSADNFDDNLRREIVGQLKGIEYQFNLAFGHQEEELSAFMLELGSLKENDPAALGLDNALAATNSPPAPIYQKTYLSALITHCRQALSSASKQGRKGHLLDELLEDLANKQTVNEDDIKQSLLELCRITSAYRPNFFQVSYGSTRSSRVLIEAFEESFRDRRFPIAQLIFGEEVTEEYQYSKNKQSFVRDKFIEFQQSNHWSLQSTGLRSVTSETRALPLSAFPVI